MSRNVWGWEFSLFMAKKREPTDKKNRESPLIVQRL